MMSNYAERARQTFDALLKHFYIQAENLYLERIPLLPEDRPYSYVWPYTGVLSAANVLAQLPASVTQHEQDCTTLRHVLDGLEQYRDSEACAYDSYVRRLGGGQKFYDDNQWIGMEFIHAFHTLKDPNLLEKAAEIFQFMLQGWTDDMGGGIYWREDDFETKNTCSNGPGAVLALMLYQETGSAEYLEWAKKILTWLKRLQDPISGVYLDAVKADGSVDPRIFTYNAGTPLHANALLYAITADEAYKEAAWLLAEASKNYFAQRVEGVPTEFFPNTPWFNAVLLRGTLAFRKFDYGESLPTQSLLRRMTENLDYAWDHARDEKGLFGPDWAGREQARPRWLLDQAAMVECYALLAQAE